MGSLPRPSGAERAGTTHFERTASPCDKLLGRAVNGAKQRDVLRRLWGLPPLLSPKLKENH